MENSEKEPLFWLLQVGKNLPERLKEFRENTDKMPCDNCGKESNFLNKSNLICPGCWKNKNENYYTERDEFLGKYVFEGKVKEQEQIFSEENFKFLMINNKLSWERKMFVEGFNLCDKCCKATHYINRSQNKFCIDCWRKSNEEATWEIMREYFRRYSYLVN